MSHAHRDHTKRDGQNSLKRKPPTETSGMNVEKGRQEGGKHIQSRAREGNQEGGGSGGGGRNERGRGGGGMKERLITLRAPPLPRWMSYNNCAPLLSRRQQGSSVISGEWV